MRDADGKRWGLSFVKGDSMRPTIGGLRRLLLVHYGATPQVGDVVIVDRPDRPGFRVVKRVTGCDEQGWWVESDNHADERSNADSWLFGPVTDAQLLGVVRWPRLSRPRV